MYRWVHELAEAGAVNVGNTYNMYSSFYQWVSNFIHYKSTSIVAYIRILPSSMCIIMYLFRLDGMCHMTLMSLIFVCVWMC